VLEKSTETTQEAVFLDEPSKAQDGTNVTRGQSGEGKGIQRGFLRPTRKKPTTSSTFITSPGSLDNTTYRITIEHVTTRIGPLWIKLGQPAESAV
jgi:hypothetical protein